MDWGERYLWWWWWWSNSKLRRRNLWAIKFIQIMVIRLPCTESLQIGWDRDDCGFFNWVWKSTDANNHVSLYTAKSVTLWKWKQKWGWPILFQSVLTTKDLIGVAVHSIYDDPLYWTFAHAHQNEIWDNKNMLQDFFNKMYHWILFFALSFKLLYT